ncbi:hypothetical protein Agabi119p4_4927 [Agaricus bisporus var. burnettii]|uniref:CCHC-type domain-containing protein n=1 Tax=Agaricus bisporus var. burnettii TaxID=192524 RepID=A0A8H7KHE2_AGABI|nr:hypothetical protein Agabi119p4_4927 [Agaricus bisporus var. burnettii]
MPPIRKTKPVILIRNQHLHPLRNRHAILLVKKQPIDKNATVRHAFLHERTAANFLSGHGRVSRLFEIVYDIGAHIDELTSARRSYLQAMEEMDTRLTRLARHLLRSPHGNEIFRRIRDINAAPLHKDSDISEPTPDRHESSPGSTSQSDSIPTPPSSIQPQQLHELAIPHTGISPSPNPSNHYPVTRTSGTNSLYRRGRTSCKLCSGMGHIQTECTLYYCHYCNTKAPGHFAKFCSRNPYAGIACRELSPSALAYVDTLINPTAVTTSESSPYTYTARMPTSYATIHPLILQSGQLQSKQSGVPTSTIHTSNAVTARDVLREK